MSKYTGKPVSLRLTEAENKIIEDQMKKRGFTNRAEFFRSMINQCEEDPVTMAGLRRALKAFSKELLEKPKRKLANK